VSVGRTIGLAGGVVAAVLLVAFIALMQALSDGVFTAAPAPAPSAP
jgi:hypothetical protein